MSDDEMDSESRGNIAAHTTGYIPSESNVLLIKRLLHPKLARFLDMEDNPYEGRATVNRFVTKYIREHGLEACESSRPCAQIYVIPDAALSNLVNYEDYCKRVQEGLHFWNRKDKETGEMMPIIETETKLTYSVLQYLLAPLFNEDKNKYEWITQDVLLLSIFMNGSQHKYLICEILENEIATFGEIFYMLQ